MEQWRQYQEDVAPFFRKSGMHAKTDVRMPGVRTPHDIDVVVESNHAGISTTWLVECKAWKSRVSKASVLAFRQIVADTGADRGFYMAENGYQKGALEAALFSNITLTSLAEMMERLGYEVFMNDLSTFRQRVANCRSRYWEISKPDRIEHKLRTDINEVGYFGDHVIKAVEVALSFVVIHGLPIAYDTTLLTLSIYGSQSDFRPSGKESETVLGTPTEFSAHIDSELLELERRLSEAEDALRLRKGTND